MQRLLLPVLQGTTRPKRQSIAVARYLQQVGETIDDIETPLVDPKDLELPFDGNNDDVKDPSYSKLTAEADGFFVVVPEYNHSFPGSLKRMLDSELSNYIHKPVAFAGVSAGPWGGVRAIESLVPAVREMGLAATFTDVQFPKVQDLFDEDGTILDTAYEKRVKKAYDELIWMARALRWGREHLDD